MCSSEMYKHFATVKPQACCGKGQSFHWCCQLSGGLALLVNSVQEKGREGVWEAFWDVWRLHLGPWRFSHRADQLITMHRGNDKGSCTSESLPDASKRHFWLASTIPFPMELECVWALECIPCLYRGPLALMGSLNVSSDSRILYLIHLWPLQLSVL